MSHIVPQNEWVNPKTGEVAIGFMSVKGRKYPNGVEFVTVFVEGFRLIEAASPTPTERRVLDHMLAHMEFGNRCAFSQSQIGRELGVSRQAVSRAMARLIATDLVFSEIGDNKTVTYQVSPSIAWRGRAPDWLREMQKRRPLKGKTKNTKENKELKDHTESNSEESTPTCRNADLSDSHKTEPTVENPTP